MYEYESNISFNWKKYFPRQFQLKTPAQVITQPMAQYHYYGRFYFQPLNRKTSKLELDLNGKWNNNKEIRQYFRSRNNLLRISFDHSMWLFRIVKCEQWYWKTGSSGDKDTYYESVVILSTFFSPIFQCSHNSYVVER